MRSSSHSRATIRVSLAWRGAHVELIGRRHRRRHPAGRAAASLRTLPPCRAHAARAPTKVRGSVSSLVRELVAMHGGTVRVDSALGAGHDVHRLAARRVRASPRERVGAARSTRLDREAPRRTCRRHCGGCRRRSRRRRARDPGAVGRDVIEARILVADDNADMREYIARLLGERWAIDAVGGRRGRARARP